MTPRPFSWLVTALGAGVINALINGALGWFLTPAGQTLPLFGVMSVLTDTVAMAFGISFGTVLVVTPQMRRELRLGKVLPPPLTPYWHDSLARWPRANIARSIQLGAWSVLMFAPLPLLALWALSVDGFGREPLAAYKGLFGFVQGALVTPLIAVAAMLGQSLPEQARAEVPAGPVG